MYVMYMVHRNEKELLTSGCKRKRNRESSISYIVLTYIILTKKIITSHTCKRTGMNLKVTKSHMGQYTSPLTNVGIKSLFNRAKISPPVSPENNKSWGYIKIMKHVTFEQENKQLICNPAIHICSSFENEYMFASQEYIIHICSLEDRTLWQQNPTSNYLHHQGINPASNLPILLGWWPAKPSPTTSISISNQLLLAQILTTGNMPASSGWFWSKDLSQEAIIPWLKTMWICNVYVKDSRKIPAVAIFWALKLDYKYLFSR